MRRRPAAVAILSVILVACGSETLPWQDPKLPPEKRVEDRIRRMSGEEKRAFLANNGGLRAMDPPADTPGIALAATFDTKLATLVAQTVALNAIVQQKQQVYGPDLTSFGEDSWLASRMGVAYVSGLQAAGIIATPKSFPTRPAADERTLREKWLPPFRAAVEEAGAWSMIASGGNPGPIDEILKNEWQFKGFVVNDPTPDQVDDKVRRILRARFAMGTDDPKAPAERPATVSPARPFVELESVVLLKNNGVLPLDPAKARTLAVIGQLPGIRERAGASFEVTTSESAHKSDIAIVNASADPAAVRSALETHPRSVVILTAAQPPSGADAWFMKAGAILWAPMPEGIAPVLFGDRNPSGRLPFTLTPLLVFADGLSYTKFEYSELNIFPATPQYGQTVQAVLNLKNAGTRAGAEVVELYVHQVKSAVERPAKELKGFQRVELKPGETRKISFELDRRSMWFYDPAVRDWVTQPGVYEVSIGSSWRDIRLKGSFELFE